MSCSGKVGTNISGLHGAVVVGSKAKGAVGLPSSSGSLSFGESEKTKFPALRIDFMGKQLVLSDKRALGDWSVKAPSGFSLRVCGSSLRIKFCYFDVTVEVLHFVVQS